MSAKTKQSGAPEAVPFHGTPASRRAFLKNGALSALAAGALGACKAPATAAAQTKAPQPHPMDHGSGAMPEKGMKAFPVKTQGKGNQVLKPRMDGGVKAFELTAKPIQWEVEPGHSVEACAYDGQVPGPQIRVREGDRVRAE